MWIILFLLLTSSAYAEYREIDAVEHCHKEQVISQLDNGDYVVSENSDLVCESHPNDWKEE